MPHPERACFLKQIPTYIQSNWADKKRKNNFETRNEKGPWNQLFTNIASYITQELKPAYIKEHQH